MGDLSTKFREFKTREKYFFYISPLSHLCCIFGIVFRFQLCFPVSWHVGIVEMAYLCRPDRLKPGFFFCQDTESVMDLDKLSLVKLCYGGLVFGSSQFLLLSKILLASKVVKKDLKIIILLRYSKSVTHSVQSKSMMIKLRFERAR